MTIIVAKWTRLRFTEIMSDEKRRCPRRPVTLCQNDQRGVLAGIQAAYDSPSSSASRGQVATRSHPGDRWRVSRERLWTCARWQEYDEEPCYQDDHTRDASTSGAGQRAHSAPELCAEPASEQLF